MVLRDYWINAGVYCLSSKILDLLPDNGNIESKTMPELAKDGKLRVTNTTTLTGGQLTLTRTSKRPRSSSSMSKA